MNKNKLITFLQWKEYLQFKDTRKNFLKIHKNIILTRKEFYNLCLESTDNSINNINIKKISTLCKKNKTETFSELMINPKKNNTIAGWCKKTNIDIKKFYKTVNIHDTTRLRITTFDDNYDLINMDYIKKNVLHAINKSKNKVICNELQYLKSVYEEENNRQIKADEKAQKIIERSSILIAAISLFGVIDAVKVIKSFDLLLKSFTFCAFIGCITMLVLSIIWGVRSVSPKPMLRPRQHTIIATAKKQQNIQYIHALYDSISENQRINNIKNDLNHIADIFFVIGISLMILDIILFYVGFFLTPEGLNTPFIIEKIKEVIIVHDYII